MATEKSALRITELDFDSIRNNIKNFLRNQSEFTDYDFEGSGMSVLLDILAYNTHYMGYYINMSGNEMFLDTAQIRSSVLSHAKLMNYVPGSTKGAESQIDVLVTPSGTEDQVSTTITLEKYTRLLGTDKDGVNYPFVTTYSNTATKSSGSFSFSNVTIKQGEVISLQYLMDSPSNPKRRFQIPSANVDIDSIIINVQESSSNTDTKTYTQAEDITEITANSTVYFVEEDENLNYTFYFGDNVIGKQPKDGNIIICTYFDNVGSVSNSITNFAFVDPIADAFSDNVRISNVVSSYGGQDKETIEQIRFRAPYFYSTQNRAVIDNDYETLIQKDYPNIDSISVWGGDKNDPVIYGKVFVSLKMNGNYYLSNFEKERIINDIIKTRSVMTVTPEIVDPDYVYIQVKGTVKYDSKLTTLTAEDIKAYVRAAVFDYSDNELNKFDSRFRKSKLQNYIENSEQSITGSDIQVYVQKRTEIDTNNRRNYTIKYNMGIKHGEHKTKLYSFPEVEVYDASNISRNVFFEEVPEVNSGINSITVVDPGINYTSVPTVTITGDGSGATATAVLSGGRIAAVEVTNAGTDYSTAIVEITGGGGSGAVAEPILDASVGSLRTYYYKTNGEKVIVNSNAGTINYDSGEVTLSSLRAYSVIENDFYAENYLTTTVAAQDEIIDPLRNRILTIDVNDPKSIQIQVVAE